MCRFTLRRMPKVQDIREAVEVLGSAATAGACLGGAMGGPVGAVVLGVGAPVVLSVAGGAVYAYATFWSWAERRFG